MVNFCTKLLQGVFYEQSFYRVVFYAVLSRRLRSNMPACSVHIHILHIIQALEKYNRIFAFLLLVRRTQAALHGLWSQAMFKNRSLRLDLMAQNGK